MGVYLNPGNDKFYKAINSEIYVDKTELIQYTNRVFNTMQQNVCVSRPRRFGKSMTANMLAAYYSRGCQSEKLFDGLKIKEDLSFPKYLNKYNVFFINMQEFLSRSKTVEKMVLRLNRILMRDLKQEYPDVDYFDEEDLAESMQDVYQQTGCPFVIIIDEWDCIFREYKSDKEAQEQYLDFLRDFLKDKSYIHLAYMTGILPVKKYGTHSALNMFDEFSMIYAGPLAKFVGFTETEVRELCEKYHMDMREIREWYDGYRFENCEPVYNPRSVVNGMLFGSIRNYWNMTESFEALQTYIDMNFEGLKDDILSMLAGENIPVNTGNFTNDMTTFRDENDDSVYRELPTGKGFADMVFIPRKKFPDKPALVVELKWDKSAKGAISQIKQKQYCKSLEEYDGNILLAEINYSKKDKEHQCMIEKTVK